MGILADSVLAGNGQAVGVMLRALVEKEIAHASLTELHVVESMHQRKALMAGLADAFLCEAHEEVGVEIGIERLLCVTDRRLPGEGQHWVSPAFLGRIVSGEARNCEPQKTREVRWFPLGALPANLTMTARNAIQAYAARASADVK
jgi:hypothetical protein